MPLLYHNVTIIKKEKELLRAILIQFCKLEFSQFFISVFFLFQLINRPTPEVLKQNYNYPFRTSEEYEWFVALDNKHVVGFVPVEHKKYECVINNYYIKERNVDTLKLLLEKVLEKQGEESSLTAVSFVEDRDVFSELGFLEDKVWTRYVKMKKN